MFSYTPKIFNSVSTLLQISGLPIPHSKRLTGTQNNKTEMISKPSTKNWFHISKCRDLVLQSSSPSPTKQPACAIAPPPPPSTASTLSPPAPPSTLLPSPLATNHSRGVHLPLSNHNVQSRECALVAIKMHSCAKNSYLRQREARNRHLSWLRYSSAPLFKCSHSWRCC